VSKFPKGPNAHWTIIEFDQVGELLPPKKPASKYKIVIGALARKYIPIKYKKLTGKDNDPWRVPESDKDVIWEKWIPQFFTFPKNCDREQIKEKTKEIMGDMLQEFQGDIVQELYPQGRRAKLG
jgi:hypothetical protein